MPSHEGRRRTAPGSEKGKREISLAFNKENKPDYFGDDDWDKLLDADEIEMPMSLEVEVNGERRKEHRTAWKVLGGDIQGYVGVVDADLVRTMGLTEEELVAKIYNAEIVQPGDIAQALSAFDDRPLGDQGAAYASYTQKIGLRWGYKANMGMDAVKRLFDGALDRIDERAKLREQLAAQEATKAQEPLPPSVPARPPAGRSGAPALARPVRRRRRRTSARRVQPPTSADVNRYLKEAGKNGGDDTSFVQIVKDGEGVPLPSVPEATPQVTAVDSSATEFIPVVRNGQPVSLADQLAVPGSEDDGVVDIAAGRRELGVPASYAPLEDDVVGSGYVDPDASSANVVSFGRAAANSDPRRARAIQKRFTEARQAEPVNESADEEKTEVIKGGSRRRPIAAPTIPSLPAGFRRNDSEPPMLPPRPTPTMPKELRRKPEPPIQLKERNRKGSDALPADLESRYGGMSRQDLIRALEQSRIRPTFEAPTLTQAEADRRAFEAPTQMQPPKRRRGGFESTDQPKRLRKYPESSKQVTEPLPVQTGPNPGIFDERTVIVGGSRLVEGRNPSQREVDAGRYNAGAQDLAKPQQPKKSRGFLADLVGKWFRGN